MGTRRGLEDTGALEPCHLGAAFVAVAAFWNQLVVLHGSEDEDFLREPKLLEMRRAFAVELNTMADVVAQKAPYTPAFASSFSDAAMLDHPRYGKDVRNTVNRLGELQGIVLLLRPGKPRIQLSLAWLGSGARQPSWI